MNYKDRAIELLGEKKDKHYSPYSSSGVDLSNSAEQDGYNQMHSKAVDVVVGLLKENEGLIRIAEENNAMMMEAAEELQTIKQKYQELKGKLFQTILESGLNTEARGYMVELGLDVNKREALNRKSVKRLENAILKYLESTNDK